LRNGFTAATLACAHIEKKLLNFHLNSLSKFEFDRQNCPSRHIKRKKNENQEFVLKLKDLSAKLDLQAVKLKLMK
jgi:hypothetical protein